jgi:hypothetical protein
MTVVTPSSSTFGSLRKALPATTTAWFGVIGLVATAIILLAAAAAVLV